MGCHKQKHCPICTGTSQDCDDGLPLEGFMPGSDSSFFTHVACLLYFLLTTANVCPRRPPAYWDDWMRLNSTRQGRQCIRCVCELPGMCCRLETVTHPGLRAADDWQPPPVAPQRYLTAGTQARGQPHLQFWRARLEQGPVLPHLPQARDSGQRGHRLGERGPEPPPAGRVRERVGKGGRGIAGNVNRILATLRCGFTLLRSGLRASFICHKAGGS